MIMMEDNLWGRNNHLRVIKYSCVITGNVFVIAAIILERNLQNVANYLVASLAVADLFVACLVMPLGAVYEVSVRLRRPRMLMDCSSSGCGFLSIGLINQFPSR